MASEVILCGLESESVFDVFQIIILQGEPGLDGTKGEKVSRVF